MDNSEYDEYVDILDLPVEPDDTWLTDEQVDAIELGELSKEAGVSQATLPTKREQENQMVMAFKNNPSKETFMPLYSSMKNMIYKAALPNMRGSQLPEAAHLGLAAQSFYDAARTFDPKKGSRFSTHMFNTVQQKGKRLNLKFQNVGYIPETRATKYQNFKNTVYVLTEELGREPSDVEIADEMGINLKEIERMRKEITKDLVGKEYYVTKGMAFAQSDKAMQVARDIYHTLEPKHQLVLEYTVGLNGKPILEKKSKKADIAAIAKAAKLSLSDVRSARKTLARKFKEYRAFMGTTEKDLALMDESED